MCPPNRSSRCPTIARVEATESCWPATWKTSVPNPSRGGRSSSHALGRKSGRASISFARTGSALRRNFRASGSATGARLRGLLSPLISGTHPSPFSRQERMQLGDLSVVDEGHVDAADRRRLFRNAHVEGEQPQVPAHVGRSCGGEHET